MFIYTRYVTGCRYDFVKLVHREVHVLELHVGLVDVEGNLGDSTK